MHTRFAFPPRSWIGGGLVAVAVMLTLGAAQPPPRRPSPPASPTATPTPAVSQPSFILQRIAERHPVSLAAYVHHLGTGQRMELNANQVFRSASLYKLFVLYEVYDQLSKGTLSPDETLTMSEQALQNEPYAEWPLGTRATVDCAMNAMITISSNAAAAMLLLRIGGEPVVTANMRARGYAGTEITVDRAFTTARDVGRLLEAVALDQAVNPRASAAMRRLLLAQRHNDRIPLPLPETVSVGHKTGELTRLRHDAGIVYGRRGPYVLVAMADQAPSAAAARAAIVDLSRDVYAWFEPDSLTSYMGLPPRLAEEIFRLPDAQGRLDPPNDPESATVPIADAGIAVAHGSESSRLREVVLSDLLALQRAAQQAGAPFWVTAGYRNPSDDDTPRLVHNPILPVGCTVEIPSDAPASAGIQRIAAGPSTPASQHWLGTVVAVSDSPDRDMAALGAEPGPSSRWLVANAWRYGFIPALPETEQGARVGYEPWRFRWVGREMAARLADAPASGSYASRVRDAFLQAGADLARR